MWVRRGRSEEPALDMTPLVDVVFLLIIFFMLSTTFIKLPGIKVDLPQASSEKIEVEKNEAVLTVDENGAFYFDEEPVDDAGMLARLSALAAGDREILVLITGDKNSHYGRVVELLGMVRKSGLHRIAIVTGNKAQSHEMRRQVKE